MSSYHPPEVFLKRISLYNKENLIRLSKGFMPDFLDKALGVCMVRYMLITYVLRKGRK